MNILQITPNYLSKRCNNGSNDGKRNMSYPNLKPLAKDTVTFGNNKVFKAAFENDYLSQLPMLQTKGQKLLKVVEECCEEVSGVTFDREYCEKALVKSLERYIEKFIDSGDVPLDRIRTSPFIKNLYDFSIITNYIKALEKRGFYILPVPDKTIGKKVLSWKYDFDIRLNDAEGKLISPEEIKKLPAHLREYVSGKQKSGYKDIQMRVVDASGLPKEKRTPKNLSQLIPEELIFLFGRATADAKTIESKYIYNIVRKLDKMHILSDDFNVDGIYKIKDNIQGIGSILRSYISKPLYRNAEKLDVYPNKTHILEDVQLDEKQCTILNSYMTDLKERTLQTYSKLCKMVEAPEYDVEIEKMIKSTQDYKTRTNKRISDGEIIDKKFALLRDLKEYKFEDLQTITKQKAALLETLQKFGIKDADRKIRLEGKLSRLDQKLSEILSEKTTLGEKEVLKLQDIQAEKEKIKEQLIALEH